MIKQKKTLILIIVFLVILLSNSHVLAVNILDGEIELSKDYLEYLELTDKENVIAPRMYDISKKEKTVTNNPFRLVRMLRRNTLQPEQYTLKEIIPENIRIKNQMATNLCWAFSSFASLESNLALQDYKKQKDVTIYDFSERHVDYATSRVFLNDEINELGFKRRPGGSGNFGIATAYLTNGSGAVSEKDMEFVSNSDLIDIEEIKNKDIITQVNDIAMFPSYSVTEDTSQIKQQMKEHIMNYGAVATEIYGSVFYEGSKFYNVETSALYCNDANYKVNHSVAIIGWDDEFPAENFVEGNRPLNNGAWIALNSYGEEFGEEGCFHISYEDVNVYKKVVGIQNAQSEITYENIYQYDKFGGYLTYRIKETPKLYLATEFEKKTEGKEYLTHISVNAAETYNCKVYVNPNGTSKEMKDLQPVEIKSGETFDAGYHTIEFAKPIKIGDKFVVVLEVDGIQEDSVTTMIEINFGEFYTDPKFENAANHIYDYVTIADEKCFIATEEDMANNKWSATSKIYEDTEGKLPNFNTTIKAFTTSKVLENIEVETPPTNTSYIEGQDFDSTGMVIKGNCANGDKINITDYIIQNGTELQLGQESVTISYNEFSVTQPIEVVKNTVESLKIITAPTIAEYWAGEDFDATGMEIEATYKDGTTQTVTNYTVQDGIELKNGQTIVTIFYEGKTVTQEILVKDRPVVKLEVTSISVKTMPAKTQYIQNKEQLDLTGGTIKVLYNNGTEKEIPMLSNEITVSGFDTKKLGTQTINLTYEGKTTQFNVEIKELAKPQNSNFDDTKIDVTRVRTYYFTDKNKKEYTILDVKLKAIVKSKENEEMKYYYYLSTNPSESNITDWIEIDEGQNIGDSLEFQINTLDVQNYEKLSNANNIYLYVKETAIKNDMEAERIAKALSLKIENINIEEYVDGKKKADVNSGTIIDSAHGAEVDNTLAHGTIPHAGKNILIVIVALVIMLFGRLVFLKYKDIEIK